MPFDVTIILPDNLTSGYLQSEFVNLGNSYSTNKFSQDPTLDDNKNTLTFGFEVRNNETRELSTLLRIKTLYLSNDKYFDPSATVAITNFPAFPTEFDATLNYIYTFNPLYFFDKTQTQEQSRTTEAGTGLFKIQNWPLSANGGLSTVYLKAILEGPNGADIEYPMGYGVFDEIIWEGEIPVNPDFPEIPGNKTGWIGKNTLLSFVSGNQASSQITNSGISRYLASVYEVSNIGGTYDALTAKNIVKRSILPSASIASTTLNSYRYYDGNYSSSSISLGANTGLTSQSFGKGVFFYSRTKLVPQTNKTDFFTQAGFSYTTSGVAVTSQVYLKLYAAPETAANSNEIVCRIDIPNDGYPTSYLYTIASGTASANKQATTLPHSVLPLLKSGGLVEMYYSSMGSTNRCLVEAYFTPYLDQNLPSRKSYLLANSILSSFGTSSVGSAFGYQISAATGITGFTGGIVLDELFMAQGKSKMSIDIGDCTTDEISLMNYPVVDIDYAWADYENEDFIYLYDLPQNLSITKSALTDYLSVSKIDANSEYEIPGVFEVQLHKPSFSNKAIFEVSLVHQADDFYVAFSGVSSYRSHTEKNLTVNWDRPFGKRCDEKSAYTDSPLDASTLLVRFSGDRKEITVFERGTDNKLIKHAIRSYEPSEDKVRFQFEITEQLPNSYNGRYKNKSANGTWLLIKEITSSNINLLGVVNMQKAIPSNVSGLGYFVALGFKESNFNENDNKIYSIKLSGVPNLYKEKYSNDSNTKMFLVSNEGLTNSQHYLGQKLLSGLTDFSNFNYRTANTLPSKTYYAATATTAVLPNSPTYSSNRFTAGSATTLSIDGYSVTNTEDIVLVKNQADPTQNGLFSLLRVGSGATSWQLQRLASFDSSSEITSNTLVNVVEGNVNSNTKWYLITPDPITLGSTGLTFSRTENLSTILSAVTAGISVDVTNLNTQTIDGISLSTLTIGSKVLVKDQIIPTENGIYEKSVSGWSIISTTFDYPFRCNAGTINAETNWYKTRLPKNDEIVDGFTNTTFFKKITLGEISPFISSIKPHLFEFKINWERYNKVFPYNELKVRFFANDDGLPDDANPLTSWKTVSYNPYVSDVNVAPNNILAQVTLSDDDWSASLSQSDVIWVAITIPFNASLAEANGTKFTSDKYINNGAFSNYQNANNLWHKLHCRYSEKSSNTDHKNAVQFRVRAVSHGDVQSHATDLSDVSIVDVNAPGYLGDIPVVEIAEESTLRNLQLTIKTEDTDSGLLAFRVGKEIDNSFITYTPWLPWSKYVGTTNGIYYIYLYGHLNYYNSGPSFSAFDKQNIGFSGSRKIWVQIMDYAGNISETNPLTFVASSQALVDTQAPIGLINFFDPRTNATSNYSNLPQSWIKIDAYDLVSGIKDFQTRRLLDTGEGSWSEWRPFSPYAKIDFSGEKDGVKKVEIKLRDFGNNSTQPTTQWNPIRRPQV